MSQQVDNELMFGFHQAQSGMKAAQQKGLAQSLAATHDDAASHGSSDVEQQL
eukprot:CAMPEP_0185594210 /NCGR_PEP_ID=MMETSP0434-20130131/74013_1 /TAXON_ID=626734 ORGANISM="Favella taraikaensis, Strain Fe Narragansett Bay" /NCGR_SAMPLE_ID=MMETSP0434 /ASSEMBLY_ACC=CAM_ASM_000379 /LENGTH=51 /DNA_ID=CAMNT_0028221345 /DNA_START=15 /DNA_END=173 /DNA_ORIENTATION=+